MLLSIDEVNEIMGTTQMEVTSELDEMTDSSDSVSDPDCLGAMFGAEEPVYDGTGWTAMRDVVAREPEEDNDHWVEQTAVLYPNADNAQEVLREIQVDMGEVRRVVARGGHRRLQLAVGVRRRRRAKTA